MSKKLMGKEVKLEYSEIISQLKFLEGKILTIVEASHSDKEQRKAAKDLVKKMCREQMAYIGQLCFPEVQMLTQDQVNETVGDVEKIKKEAEPITK